MSETLSPSELQSLFAGLDLAGGAAGPHGRSFSTSDPNWSGDQFTLPLTLTGEEQAALLAWQAAFGKDWSAAWTEPFASRFRLGKVELHVIRMRDFVTDHASWQGFQVTAGERGFPVWLALDDPLLAAHLDCLLGGDEGATRPALRARGPLEQQLAGRLVQSVCASLFAPQTAARWQVKAVNSTTDWIAGIPVYLACEIVQFDFEIVGPGAIGQLSLGIPRGACHKLHSPQTGGIPAVTSSSTTVQLRVTLPTVSLSPTEFQQLQVGDVLLTSQNDRAPCQVFWGGRQRFTASVGSHQGHKAIRLTAAKD